MPKYHCISKWMSHKNELYAEEPPPPIVANAIVFNGTDGYIEFAGGWGTVMDYTYDWSMAVTMKIQGHGALRTTLSTCWYWGELS